MLKPLGRLTEVWACAGSGHGQPTQMETPTCCGECGLGRRLGRHRAARAPAPRWNGLDPGRKSIACTQSKSPAAVVLVCGTQKDLQLPGRSWTAAPRKATSGTVAVVLSHENALTSRKGLEADATCPGGVGCAAPPGCYLHVHCQEPVRYGRGCPVEALLDGVLGCFALV